MSALEEAKAALAAFPVKLPVSFTVTGPGEPYELPHAVTGTFRSKEGRALIVPVHGSTSMIAGFPAVLDFLAAAPKLLADLIEEVESDKAEEAEKWRKLTPEELKELETDKLGTEK